MCSAQDEQPSLLDVQAKNKNKNNPNLRARRENLPVPGKGLQQRILHLGSVGGPEDAESFEARIRIKKNNGQTVMDWPSKVYPVDTAAKDIKNEEFCLHLSDRQFKVFRVEGPEFTITVEYDIKQKKANK